MRILIASAIDGQAVEKLQAEHDVTCAYNLDQAALKTLIADRDILIFRSGVQITADVMAAAPDLKLILRAGSGVDNIDLDYVERRGIYLVRIPGPGARAVAEMAFALMLALSRNVVVADRLLRQGRWAKNELTGYLLHGKVLGVIGTGNIGTVVGRLGVAWGMEVLGSVEKTCQVESERLRRHGIRCAENDEILAAADFVTVHVPLTPETRYLLDAAALARMKPGAFLVNLARGGVVDEKALYQALAGGHLAGAAMDVHEQEGEGHISPLAELPNVILTPHIGASAIDSQREIGRIILQTIDSFVAEDAAGLTAAQALAQPAL
jgi:D-3-phosphoglycerate dehydrogenase / 2-oxoglutarate reductase